MVQWRGDINDDGVRRLSSFSTYRFEGIVVDLDVTRRDAYSAEEVEVFAYERRILEDKLGCERAFIACSTCGDEPGHFIKDAENL